MIPQRPEIAQLHAYVPGKSIEEIQEVHNLKRVVKLASNENPLGPPPKAIQAILAGVDQFHLYPRGDAPDLVAALSARMGLEPAQFILGNGSDEVLALIAQAFVQPSDEALACVPTFSVYQSTVQLMGGVFRGLPLRDQVWDLDAMLDAVGERTRLVYVCNPNNPTGTYVGDAPLRGFLRKLPPRVLVVVDQAYCEYATASDYPYLVDALSEFPNLLLVRTFSKVWGLAGLRVGYGIGAPDVIAALQKVKPPFNVSLPAQWAARAAIQDSDHFNRSLELNNHGMARLQHFLESCGWACLPSQANFIATCTGPRTGELVAWLETQGLIVRWLCNFGMPQWVRITVGTDAELDFLEGLLTQWRARS